MLLAISILFSPDFKMLNEYEFFIYFLFHRRIPTYNCASLEVWHFPTQVTSFASKTNLATAWWTTQSCFTLGASFPCWTFCPAFNLQNKVTQVKHPGALASAADVHAHLHLGTRTRAVLMPSSLPQPGPNSIWATCATSSSASIQSSWPTPHSKADCVLFAWVF